MGGLLMVNVLFKHHKTKDKMCKQVEKIFTDNDIICFYQSENEAQDKFKRHYFFNFEGEVISDQKNTINIMEELFQLGRKYFDEVTIGTALYGMAFYQ